MILLIFVLFIAIYFYTTRNFNYWIKRNVKYDTPLPFFGNHLLNTLGLKSITTVSTELYQKYSKEKVVGYFRGSTPELIIRDLDIARCILNVDFAYFHPRGLTMSETKDILSKNIFNADGDSWKLVRQRLTTAFTKTKLKGMFPLIISCTEKLQGVGDKIVEQGGDCDIRELMARFSTEFIGACGFGIEMDTINDENSMFRQMGKKVFTTSLKEVLLRSLRDLIPELKNTIRFIDKNTETIVTKISMKIFELRNYKPSGRNDFVDLLLELAAQGKIVGDSIEHVNSDGTPKQTEVEMDLHCLVAQVFIFFAAGFETSASATSFTLHQLAFHPDIQNKIQNEIDQIISKYNNKLCYDAVAEMNLLDMALKESMRLFHPVGNLYRVCAKKYTFSDLDITIDPGVKIIIPVQAIQNDEQFFPNPSEFRPERFSPEELNKTPKYSYLPFGEGPRSCVGARLGQMQSLAGLAAILHKFSVEPAKNTQRKLQLDHQHNFIQTVLNGIPLKLKLRNNKINN